MTVNTRTRGWFGAASQGAVDALGKEVGRLADELGALRADHLESEERQADHLASLREDLTQLADRCASQVEGIYAKADDLAEAVREIEQGSAGIEQLRVNLAGVAEQLRWESEDLRKGLAAVIERVERERKTA